MTGLREADDKTRKKVARIGGKAPHKSRSLQSADKVTRQRVAKIAGKVRGLDKEGLSKAGRKGGGIVKQLFGTEFFENWNQRRQCCKTALWYRIVNLKESEIQQ